MMNCVCGWDPGDKAGESKPQSGSEKGAVRSFLFRLVKELNRER